MAGTVKVTQHIECANGSFEFPAVGKGVKTIIQNAVGGGLPGSVTATTAGNTVDLSALTVKGYARLQNLDDTNYVQWGHHDGSDFFPVGRMKAGETAGPFRLDAALTLHVKANTADCLLQVLVFED
jgi:hypothetical protein